MEWDRIIAHIDSLFRYILSGFITIAVAMALYKDEQSLLDDLRSVCANSWLVIVILGAITGAFQYSLNTVTLVPAFERWNRWKRGLSFEKALEVDFARWRRRLIAKDSQFADHLAIQNGLDRWNSICHFLYTFGFVVAIPLLVFKIIGNDYHINRLWWIIPPAVLVVILGLWSSNRCRNFETEWNRKNPLPDNLHPLPTKNDS